MNRGAGLLGAVLVVIGVLWLLDALDVVDVLRWAVIGPVLLIALGTSMIVTGWRGRGDGSRTLADAELSEVAVLADRDLVAGPVFAGGTVTAVLADVDLDLRGADLASSSTTLVVTAVLGDVDVHVPPSWRVRTAGSPVMSEVDVRRAEPPPDVGPAPVLVVQAAGLFGDVTVR